MNTTVSSIIHIQLNRIFLLIKYILKKICEHLQTLQALCMIQNWHLSAQLLNCSYVFRIVGSQTRRQNLRPNVVLIDPHLDCGKTGNPNLELHNIIKGQHSSSMVSLQLKAALLVKLQV